AWENKKGEIEYAALVNPETLDELDGLKAKVQELETAAPVVTMQDVDILKQAGLIDDADPDKEEDEDMELNETAPLAEVKETENPAPKTKPKKGGISKAGLITIAAIAVVLLILTYIPILKKAKNAQDKAAVEDIMFGNSSFRGSNMLRNLSKLSNPLRG
ncbi:MAG: hypothetical protein Q4Q04_05090, partial [Methanocorpusculum sp.]|nr:hypothetical protein [Methanocorpusculum sp.]